MKNNIIVPFVAALIALAPLSVPRAEALSCLPVEDYVRSVVGKDEFVFVGTVVDQVMEKNYTAEVIKVESAKQGYVADTVMVYHKKDETWGYFCNNGPLKKGEKGLYIVSIDTNGTYNVNQRLTLTDPLVKTLEADLKKADIEGGVSEITKEDRLNQIMTTIVDLFAHISLLLKEYAYFKAQ